MSIVHTHTRLSHFEDCPKRYYHYDFVRDIKEGESEQLRAGNVLHQAFHDRLIRGTPLPLGMGQHEKMLAGILASPGETYGEQKLAINVNFEPAGWYAKDAYVRTIIDAAKINNDKAIVFDWKTGKPSTDISQLRLVSAVMFAHSPALQRIRAALVFVNHDEVTRAEFTRDDLPEIWAELLPRMKALEAAHEAQEFPPKPNGLCKRWCQVVACPHYGKGR